MEGEGAYSYSRLILGQYVILRFRAQQIHPRTAHILKHIEITEHQLLCPRQTDRYFSQTKKIRVQTNVRTSRVKENNELNRETKPWRRKLIKRRTFDKTSAACAITPTRLHFERVARNKRVI